MSNPPYARWPSLRGESIVFVAEDDLWTVPAAGGIARRLTTALATVACPLVSPDGETVAFTGRDEGFTEVFAMPAAGGEARRLTFTGAAPVRPMTWTDDGALWYGASTEHPFGLLEAYELRDLNSAPQRHAELGALSGLAFANGHRAIARNSSDSARWKRYRGGTAGEIWVQTRGAEGYTQLTGLESNLNHPLWVGDRLFFVSDHEGVGNIYSCDPADLSGTIKRHTNFTDYYVRWPSCDGARLAFHAGGDIFILDTTTDDLRKVEVELHSPRVQRQRKFVTAERNLETFDLQPQAREMLITARGRLARFALWEGAVRGAQHEGGRQRLATWLHDGERFVALDDSTGEEQFVLVGADGQREVLAEIGDVGRPVEMVASPTDDRLLLTNHRYELVLVDLAGRSARVIDRSAHGRIASPCFAPDGRWYAYSCPAAMTRTEVRLGELVDGVAHRRAATKPILADSHPSFSPDGEYLVFLSSRVFNPVYDDLHFSLGFPRGTIPCLVTLKASTPSPFEPQPRAIGDPLGASDKAEAKDEAKDDAKRDGDEAKSKKDAVKPVEVDVEGFADRVLAFPVEEGRYLQVLAAAGHKVLYTRAPVKGALGQSWASSEPPATNSLFLYDFDKLEETKVCGEVSYVELGKGGEVMVLRKGNRLRVCKVAEKLPKEGGASRQTGWLDLNRIRVEIDPPVEWAQMMREAWRLQRDHFWDDKMSNVDWQLVFDRYRPLLDRISSRSEFSDLMWEMQGELGTSHAYEMGGDHRSGPRYPQGRLGADIRWDEGQQAWRIARILRGDSWSSSGGSPLAQPGLKVAEGQLILAVNGRPCTREASPGARLVNLGGQRVELTLAESTEGERWQVTVKTIIDETPARYREWVDACRERVHAATDGRIGYVHIPDMGPEGFAEFFRGFLAEADREGLIIDARFNRGGHVSQLLLEKLSRKRLGYDAQRHGSPEPYPAYSFDGPMVALTNQHAGSDGDIFCHSFKMLELGPLIGKRTWGGVVGIHPRHFLADGTITTQPEFSFWFKDVGYGVENYGTEPDIEVDAPPLQTSDAQLERGIAEALARLEANPPMVPNLDDRPDRSLPRLEW